MQDRPAVSAFRRWVQENFRFLCTVFGVVLGFILGLAIRPLRPSDDVIQVISYPGEFFTTALKLMVLPFTITCVIVGTATFNVSENRKIAYRTLIYVVTTSLINVVLGMAVVTAIQPGNMMKANSSDISKNIRFTKPLDGILDMGRNLVPQNLFQAAFQHTFTVYVPVVFNYEHKIEDNGSNHLSIEDSHKVVLRRKLLFREGLNTLGITFFCFIFGCVLGTLGPNKVIVISFFNVIYDVIYKILLCIMWFTPLRLGSLVCGKVISVAKLSETLTQIGWFILTVFIGLAIYQLIILQIIYYIFVRRNPYLYYLTFGPSITTAFKSSSKSVALPVAIRIMDENAIVDKRITKLILPIGTMNLDGTALFISIAVIFIAQMNNIVLETGDLLIVGFVCTIASMSSTTVPSASLDIVTMLCGTIDAPIESMALIVAVDWFVDRMRTTNNILGDVYGCAIIESLSRKELEIQKDDETIKKNVNGSKLNTTEVDLEASENTKI